jgi:hypothetical protein
VPLIREYRHLFNGPRRIVATIRISLNRMERLHAGALAIIRCEWDGTRSGSRAQRYILNTGRGWTAC